MLRDLQGPAKSHLPTDLYIKPEGKAVLTLLSENVFQLEYRVIHHNLEKLYVNMANNQILGGGFMCPPFLFFKKIFKSMMNPFYSCLTGWSVKYSCFMLDIPMLKEDLSGMGKVFRAIISFYLLRLS